MTTTTRKRVVHEWENSLLPGFGELFNARKLNDVFMMVLFILFVLATRRKFLRNTRVEETQ